MSNVIVELSINGDIKDSMETTYDDEGRFTAILLIGT